MCCEDSSGTPFTAGCLLWTVPLGSLGKQMGLAGVVVCGVYSVGWRYIAGLLLAVSYRPALFEGPALP